MGFSAPSLPPPPPPPNPPILAGGSAQMSAQQEAMAAAAAEGRGFAGTIATGPQGAQTPNLAKQTLGG